MKIALIVSYFNRPELASLSLYSLQLQTRKADEILVCDDGSTEVLPWKDYGVTTVIRQEHDGWGKERLLNKAITITDADYLIFCDSDCVFECDWIGAQEKLAKEGYTVLGMYTSLLKEENFLVTMKTLADRSVWRSIDRAYNSNPPVWAGCGSTVWRKDALAVNGFDERLKWCGPDFNFGLRLFKMGIQWIHFSHYGRFFHLWHERPWAENYDKKTANELARKWASESIIAGQGIKQMTGKFEITAPPR